MKLTYIPVKEFAGLDLDTQPLLAERDGIGRLTASTARNVTIDQVSKEIRKVPGSSAWAPALTGGPANGVYEHVASGGERTVIAHNDAGYFKLDAGRTAWTSMHASARKGENAFRPSFAQVGNYLAIVDGLNAWYWDGQSDYLVAWRPSDLEAPKYRSLGTSGQRPKTTHETGTTFTVGDKFEVFCTLYNGTTGIESPPSRILGAGPSVAGTQDIKIHTGYAKTGAGNAADGNFGAGKGHWAVPAGVTHIRFYRSAANTPGVWYLIDSGAGGSVAVAADTEGDEITTTIDGATVGGTAYAGYNGPPTGTNIVVGHIQRAFVLGSPAFPNRLWWTAAGSLDFSSTSWLTVGDSRDRLVAAVSFPLETPTLGLLCRNSVWTLGGYDDTSFAAGLRQVASGPGCMAPHAVAMANGTAYFWGSGGFYRFDGLTVEPIDAGIHTAFMDAIKGVE